FYYAVQKGRKQGVYKTWEECKKQVIQFAGAKYRKFATLEEAESFVAGHDEKQYDRKKRKRMNNDDDNDDDRPRSRHPKADLVVYTDGAAAGNGQHGAKAGYGVFWGKDDARN
ncbi:Caulimovirus viroplasmin-domain-containing protein, partial [Halteromyces radiatus]|uniref:Caulimovirus viroplasmin-domain-containing protein n=1 Tax=Halteromyces radiatus TaxID=101107 RepID=UPI00221F1DBE